MTPPLPQPVIIGTGLTGLAISRVLSEAKIDHVLVGKRPSEQPRLGESLDTTGTLDLLDSYSEFSRFYYPKSEFRFWLGDHAVTCDLRFADSWQIGTSLRLSGFTPPRELLHVDRIGFDQALFEKVIERPTCRWEDGLVERVEYDAATDRVGQVHLSNGQSFPSSYVFDATSHRGPVPIAVGLGCRELSSLQLVVFAHYRKPKSEEPCKEATESWESVTTLLRLMQQTDEVDAFAWCIPIGDTISIGVTAEAEQCALEGEELLEHTERAFASRGLHLRRRFSDRTAPTVFRHKYFMQERVSGANWLLAGPSACQVWFMSAAGVGMGLAAARIAPKLLADPARYGRRYQKYVDGLETSHRILERLRYEDPTAKSCKMLHKEFDRLIHSNVKRTGRYFQLLGRRRGTLLSMIGYGLARTGLVLSKYCSFSSVTFRR